jgi:CheY-like chemotaxis protein
MHTFSRRIIIVDAVNEFIQHEKTLLNRQDFSLLTVSSGNEALFKAQHEKPDLMILNFFMPDLNGFKVCRKIKGDPSTEHIPVLIITAYSDEDEDPCSLSEMAGCDGCITKPIQHDDFVPMVEKHLGIPPRRHDRSDVSLPCSVTDEDGQRDGTILNLTPEGVCIETSPAPWQGDIVKAEMSLDAAPFEFQLAVRWSKDADETSPGKAGAEFLSAPEELLGWLENNS